MAFLDLLKPKVNKEERHYGFCPECGANGAIRERRMDGNDKCANGHTYPSKSALTEKIKTAVTEAQKAEDVLRNSGYKIRLIMPTSFGTQIDLAKLYNPADITKVLSDFQIKIKDKSVFIVK
jgi:hypothetical protein